MATRSTQSAYDIEMLRKERDDARSELAALRKRVAELEHEQKQSAFDLQEYKLNIRLMQKHNIKQQERIAELEAAQAIVTPNNCRHCHRAAEQMREAAATFLDSKILTDEEVEDGIDWSQDAPQLWATDIRALPLPACDGCNPLKPE